MKTVNWVLALSTLARRFSGLPAVVTAQGGYTFDEVMGRAAAVAEHLRGRIPAGEPVATLLPNSAEAVWASYGVLLSGAAETALNAGLGASELKYCLDLIGIKHIVTNARLSSTVRAAGGNPIDVNEIGSQAVDPFPGEAVAASLWGKVLFTSGTTGQPKAIIHSHGMRWLANQMLRANLPFQPGPGSRILLMTPYSHGASLLTAAFHDSGASIYLMDGVQIDRVKQLLTDGEVDCIFAPPTVLAKITSALDGFTCNSLRAIFSGTATLTPTLYQSVRAMFGPVVRITYGKTEVFNPITVLQPAECDAAFSSGESELTANLGWPVSGVEIEIRDDNGGRRGAGETGRIFIRAPHMMIGHVDQAGYHAAGPNEWHESGDIGYVGARGALMLCGRDHDMIKIGGYKMFPREVEAPIEAAGVGDVVAFGLPSAYWGEVLVVAAERPAEGWQERARQAVEGLSKQKKPRAYVAVSEFPRNSQGKVQRSKLLSQLLAQYRLRDGPQPQLIPAPDVKQ